MSWPEVWFESRCVSGRRRDWLWQPRAWWQLEDDTGRVIGEAREVDADGIRRWLKRTRMRVGTRLRLEVRDERGRVQWWLERPGGWIRPAWMMGTGPITLARVTWAPRQLVIEQGSGLNWRPWGVCRYQRALWGVKAWGQLETAAKAICATLRWWRTRWYHAVDRWELRWDCDSAARDEVVMVGISCALILGCAWTER